MTDSIKKLTRKRRSILKSIQDIYDVAKLATTDDKFHSEFLSRYEGLDSYTRSFESVHYDIVALVEESGLDEEDNVQIKFENLRYSIRTMYRDLFENKNIVGNLNAGMSSAGAKNDSVRLPKIEIPKFDGDIKKWPTFFDLFNTLIHNNKNLSDIERFQFLISYLEKEASLVVKNLPITESNYAIAYLALKNRYQNERVMLTGYWISLYNASPTRHDSAVELRSLLSIFSENLSALEQNEDLDLWDFTKFNLLLQKIHPSLKTRFEMEFSGCSRPTFENLFNFIEKSCRALENTSLTSRIGILSLNPSGSIGGKGNHQPKGRTYVEKGKQTLNFSTTTSKKVTCIFCNTGSHSLSECDRFLEVDSRKRFYFVKQKGLCFNCLTENHTVGKCHFNGYCETCGKKHHSLLHFVHSNKNCDSDGVHVLTSTVSSQSQPMILLATALVSVVNGGGQSTVCRVLLDSGSQANFISETFAKRLGLTRVSFSTPVQGINGMSMCTTLGKVACTVSPHNKSSPTYNMEAIVVPNICEKAPPVPVSIHKWKYLENLCLAEPLSIEGPGDIDMLLGVEMFGNILCPGYIKGRNGGPHALNTVFGWVLMGKVDGVPSPSVFNFLTSIDSVDETLKRFWEIESVPLAKVLSPEDQKAEDLFTSSCARLDSGRYSVALPFREFPPILGDSYAQAHRRFNLLEARLQKDPVLGDAYRDFMRDYLDQGHMCVAATPCDRSQVYYIPHHGVVKGNGDKIRLRVVFDASAKTSNGKSLNDVLLVGPKLQNNIMSILLSLRLYPIVFTADIRQMYRQILVNELHRDFQRILWRFDPKQPVKEYQLKTVTYGVSSSPFLAIRTLLELANDEGNKFPLAVKILRDSCYVDDAIGMADSIETARQAQKQLTELLSLGQFELRKWASNYPLLLTNVPEAHKQPISFDDRGTSGLKVLGLQWCPVSDSFCYSVQPELRPCTKRNVLSEIAKIYDPLGFLAPTVIIPKQLMQQMWALGVGWDEKPPVAYVTQWQNYIAQLPKLSTLQIPRYIMMLNPVVTELHAFCDASEKSYAAVVYIRQICCDNISVFLLCAKSRVAPLKRLSVPRLELCSALLLAELVEFVAGKMSNVSIDRIFAWADSTVALTWIKSPPNKWRTFVANRVALIQEKVSPASWFHVSGKENPADCASRGVHPQDLLDLSIWWNGPSWLKLPQDGWPVFNLRANVSHEVEAEERKVVCVVSIEPSIVSSLVSKFSSLRKIKGILAYCLRFKQNCLSKKNRSSRITGALCENELYDALIVMVKDVQGSVFCEELRRLASDKHCSKPFRKLTPFLDEMGVLRVGGRLRHSSLSFDQKHPVLLPREHRLTVLIIEDIHRRNCHPGPQTMQYLLMQQFWILSGKRAINSVLSKCIRCFRTQPSNVPPLMSDLPPVRVAQVKSFSHSGVDFFGPLRMTLGKKRGVSSQKVYVCLFVCMSTKAIHLEVVSDLTSEAFLAALRRFVGRRGRCSHLYSDQGTNFVGANKALQLCQISAESLAIKWHFNPPASPSFGGLWESGVKSVKTHLRRVVGEQILTFEELTTVLIQIEAMLNSRPLCSLSSDPNDLSSLSPGHFLTLEPLTAPPEDDLHDLKVSRLTRWQLVQQLQQHFWRRWHVEYLHTLQQRQKWNCTQNPPQVGALVVIKDENVPPLRWPLGRLVQLFEGSDGVCRVAQVFTTKGLLVRPLLKLCPLPTQ